MTLETRTGDEEDQLTLPPVDGIETGIAERGEERRGEWS